eukprot:TRINITY_DN14223_c0_g1_i3.p1 TRINITY_DN14223_c0_g1~~TRINITY_DN14223_c0_g1_i3.p1  ORF type:complete len:491 (+),score=149.21 TRINITY_DN14223_c0_g1_i3:92-1474(+)
MPLDAELAALGEEIAKLKERRERGWRKWAYAIAAAGPVPSPAELAAALSEPRAPSKAEVAEVLADVLDRVRRRSWTYYDGTPLPLPVQEELEALSRRQHPQTRPSSPARSQPQQQRPASPARSQPQQEWSLERALNQRDELGWTPMQDPSSGHYYYVSPSGEAQWEAPPHIQARIDAHSVYGAAHAAYLAPEAHAPAAPEAHAAPEEAADAVLVFDFADPEDAMAAVADEQQQQQQQRAPPAEQEAHRSAPVSASPRSAPPRSRSASPRSAASGQGAAAGAPLEHAAPVGSGGTVRHSGVGPDGPPAPHGAAPLGADLAEAQPPPPGAGREGDVAPVEHAPGAQPDAQPPAVVPGAQAEGPPRPPEPSDGGSPRGGSPRGAEDSDAAGSDLVEVRGSPVRQDPLRAEGQGEGSPSRVGRVWEGRVASQGVDRDQGPVGGSPRLAGGQIRGAYGYAARDRL